ncbi:hypothetical protein B0A48_09762 [Cryoendolithus antarcticus]|uniref:Uncharacterized protein n=1 Tax=Cryoendolithus antarcticus TaxID=1507870 RepID=A0A1V8T2V5_9PEZI|nr:hypothetical protein B0A48_09762 [Cryoendolithus antarcticus]
MDEMDESFDFAGHDADLEAITPTATSIPTFTSTNDSPPESDKCKNLSASTISTMIVDPHLATHEVISAYLAERDNNEQRQAQHSPFAASRTSPASVPSQRQAKPRYSTSREDHQSITQIAHATPYHSSSTAASQTQGPPFNGLGF